MLDTPSSDAPRADASLTPTKSVKEIIELANTGERFLPGAPNSTETAYDHLTRYRFAERYVRGKTAIDLGCGAGYGTYSLAKVAQNILGVDLSMEAIVHAAERYQAPNLRYEVGNVVGLPYEAGSFQVAVSFEVIEHLQRPEELVLEAKRLLKDDGVFVVSTPNKQTYSNNQNRVNLYHLKEMYPPEFQELLELNFQHVQLHWQGALAGSVITPDPREIPKDGQGTLESAQFSLDDPAFGDRFPTTLYMVAVCTNGEAPEPLHKPFLIIDRDRQIYSEYDDQQHSLRYLQMHHNHILLRQKQQANKRVQEAHKRVQEAHMMLQEAHRMIQEDRRRFRQPIGRLQEVNKLLQETNQQLQQEKEHFQESDGHLKEVSKTLQEKDQQLLEVSKRLEERNQQLHDVRKWLWRVNDEIACMQSTFRWKIAYNANVLYRKIVPSRKPRDNEHG